MFPLTAAQPFNLTTMPSYVLISGQLETTFSSVLQTWLSMQWQQCLPFLLPHASKVLFLVLSVAFLFVFFCLWIKYLRYLWTDVRQILCLIPCSDEFQCQGHQGQKPHSALSSPRAAMEWNTLVANNIMQQQMGPFCRCWGWFRQLACGLCLVKHL